jgi:hypothetical protein
MPTHDRRGAHFPTPSRSQSTKAGIARRQQRRLEQCEEVPVAPFRSRFLALQRRGEINANAMAVHLGWLRSRNGCASDGDGTRVRRTLGIREHRGTEREAIPYELGTRLADLLGMDPTDCGL